MAELNFKQITDKLNAEFTGDVRKLIFWYDANGEFKDNIDSLQLENAKIYHLEPDNQFYTKYFLECEDKTTNYLVYAPFAKLAIRDNHIADTIRYSKEFFADSASLFALDLGIDERFKPVNHHYVKKYDRLLCDGIWCIVQLEYEHIACPKLAKEHLRVQTKDLFFNVVWVVLLKAMHESTR